MGSPRTVLGRASSVTLTSVLLVALPGVAAQAGAQSVPGAYADSLTAALVIRARELHLRQDSLVRDYQALVRTRIDASAGASRFARMVPLIAHETAARVSWRRPDDLKLNVLGARSRAAFGDGEADALFERPWFIPRALGDSIRLMGLPETAALHPLAPDAEAYYRYAIRDSVVMRIPGRTVRAVAVRVEPRRMGPSLVAGDVWIDALSGDVVRLTVTFLGEYLWDAPDTNATPSDSAAARRDNKWAQRFFSVQADLEYALYENLFWMPYRQLLHILVEWDIFLRGALPVRAVTTFHEYRINTGAPIVFVLPLEDGEDGARRRGRGRRAADSARERSELGFDRGGRSGAGRWEISYPPRDSLRAYEWPEELALDLDAASRDRIRDAVAELSRLTEALPDSWMGRPQHSLQWERFGDVIRYNRVQGPSIGVGYEWRPGAPFTTVHAGARLGLSDLRPTGRLGYRRDAPGGGLDLAAYRSVHEAEPWTGGQGLGNSLNALFTGHDEADYYLALGGAVSFRGYRGATENLTVTLAAERHRSMAVEAGWIGGDAVDVRPNPPVTEADFLRLRLAREIPVGRIRLQLGAEGVVGRDLTVSGSPGIEAARGWLTARVPFRALRRTGALSLKTGATVGEVPSQLAYRVGGPETVRGYGYGFRGGSEFWSAQLDWALVRNWLISPVLFVDAGGTFDTNDPLVGAGAGLSLLGGWMRLNLAKGLNPGADVRFDLLFAAPR